MIQAITQAVIEAAKAAITAVREADGPTKGRGAIQASPRTYENILRQPNFNCKVQDKHY